MIEAVNSVIANASVLRGPAEQASAARSFAANPDRVQEVILAPYVSPYIHVDVNYDKAVLQIRDGDTGNVLKQFPSEAALEVQSRLAARLSTQAQAASVPEREVRRSSSSSSSSPQPQTFVASEPSAPQPQQAVVNAQAQVAAEALASTAAQAQAVSSPPTSGNVDTTA